MTWLVALAKTDHRVELNTETAWIVSIFPTMCEQFLLKQSLKFYIGNCRLWCAIGTTGLYPSALSWCFFPSQFTCTVYLPYSNILTLCLNICCSPHVLHQMLELESSLEAACNTIKFFEHRQVKKLLSNSTLHQESDLESCLLPW